MPDVQDTVFGIIAEKAKVDRSAVSRDTVLTSLDLDSLDTIEAVFQIEETFDISVMFNANVSAGESRIVTAGDVVDLVTAQIKPGDASIAP